MSVAGNGNAPLRVGVIGFGYWGPNLVRNFAALEGATVTMVADRDAIRRKQARRLYPKTEVLAEGLALVTSENVDAVAIAVPAAAHYELTRAALAHGKHVLVCKPLACNGRDCDALTALAQRQARVLMVDHTFVFTGAVRKIHELITGGELGDLYYYASTRVNLGKLQQDVSVLWDLAVHDLSILDYLVSEEPSAIQAEGLRYVGQQDEVASVNLRYPSGFAAHIRVSWLSPVKIRFTELVGSRKMVVYDDVEPSEKVKLYDKGVALDQIDETPAKPVYRAGDVFVPTLDRTEALEVMAHHFLDCVKEGRRPLTDGRAGARVVRWLEAARHSASLGGEFVPLAPSGGSAGAGVRLDGE